MSKRAYNFNAGPAALPLEVLQQAQAELVDYKGIGMSIMEISHRSKEYDAVHAEAQELFKELLNIPDGYKVLFLQGGASTQFAMVPMNLLSGGKVAHYVHTGSWANKAIKEAKLFGEVAIAASSKDSEFTHVPDLSNLSLGSDAAYLHITSNETIGGIQYKQYPATGSVPLVADMSSDILCRPIDVSQFGLIYAGAQKNLGPSGVTVVILREDLAKEAPESLPTMMRYATHVEGDSLYNTPPVFSVYMVGLVLKWIKSNGGLAAMEQSNEAKTKLIYDAIDASGGFYRGVAAQSSRSTMNITFRMADEEMEKRFLQEAAAQGFVGLKGHRSVGGLRASTYNAVPFEACRALAEFMVDFQKRSG
ncbi:3-phosphoserine/phosphohydroxythreonine transaminase [Xylanibacillus composti]|uniref:Phosphoserine aminotransferase n=1 Tax=Xylanibacillus composti TaxID=1572762 RepID=A0A8J4H4J5_9BACL|nr:3-phosphoserine/phosphohydroxythreonine transaminase [Xylanibacillus composti]MDT9724723.1 3-phosphoserine/phosphohydroxythreonine transaminase [Xylanibacillus composti]GIQ70724.1 phosphoserine aminotransferase [Xylanibacillus composti]